MQNAKDFGLDDVFTLEAFVERYPTLFRGETGDQKLKSLRWLVFKSNTNGLAESGAIVGNRKATRIVAPRFRSWLLSQARTAA